MRIGVRQSRQGQGLVEYAFLLALIAMLMIFSLTTISSTINDAYYGVIANNLSDVSNNAANTFGGS